MLTKVKMAKVKEAEKIADEAIKKQAVTIPRPLFRTASVRIVGNAPLVVKRFDTEAAEQIRTKQAEGSTAGSRTKRAAKDFDALYLRSHYRSPEGWYGFPASGFRKAMVRACSLTDVKMTQAKMAVFIVADGIDATTPDISLVRIDGKPRKIEHALRNDRGGADIRVRTSFDKWSAVLKITFDAALLTETDIANLLMRAGIQVGIGEGRPMSRDGPGCGWGTFDVEGV